MKPAIWAEIHRLHEIEQLSDRQIAIEVGCSRYKVQQALRLHQPPLARSSSKREKLIDPFREHITQILAKHPSLSAVRILEKIAKPEGEAIVIQGDRSYRNPEKQDEE